MSQLFKSVPKSVATAVAMENQKELSDLGKKGAEAKKKKRLRKLTNLIRECAKRDREANLDICPID